MSSLSHRVDGPRFLELVVLSELLTAEQVKDFSTRYLTDEWEEFCSDKDALANEFVKHNLLTSWQAKLLLAGKYKGFMLGKYKLLTILGSGGMSSVYLAEHAILRRQVAVKVLPKSLVENQAAFAHFINSARQEALISKNVHFLHAHDIDNVGWTHFVVMDYEPGKTLKSIVHQEGPLTFYEATNYIAQAADGLDALHSAAVIHFHLDPEHLYLTESGVIKILGTGILWGAEENRQYFAEFISEKILRPTASEYHAPELEQGVEQARPQSDIYSLGCAFYYLLTGHAPCPADTSPQRIQHELWQAFSDLRRERPDTPPRLIEILERMLAKNPSDRYASSGALYRDLDAFLRDEGGEDELTYVS